MTTHASPPEKIGPFQLIVLILSLVVLFTLVIDTVADVPGEVSRLLHFIDNAVCVVLLIDFLVRLRQARSKIEFMKWGWIDLIASIPTIGVLRFGRLVRVIRVLRLLRGVRLIHRLLAEVFRNRLQGGVAAAFLTVFLLLCFSSVAILICERSPDANIKTAGDAVWWSFTTVTTVGYGDRYPVTNEGRMVAILLMLSGVGLFGTISGLTATMFVGGPEKKDGNDDLATLTEQVRQLRLEIAQLRGKRAGGPTDTD